jgi:ferredoxin/flavodoxin
MRVMIIVFSPTGNTLKVAEMIRTQLLNTDIQVKLLDITREKCVFHEKRYHTFFKNKASTHDLLLVGGPVYAHHFHFNVLEILKKLPRPNKVWGKTAIPFVTYGGISSGTALFEAAKALQKTGRRVVLAMKINAFHVISRILTVQHNAGMPGDEAIPVIKELVARIKSRTALKSKNIVSHLNYQSLAGRLKAKFIFREKIWQRHLYPKLKINRSICTGCGNCITHCPVQRLCFDKDHLITEKKETPCIHCTECVSICPAGALDFNCNKEKWNKLFAQAIAGKGILPSREEPKSCVYPHTSNKKGKHI